MAEPTTATHPVHAGQASASSSTDDLPHTDSNNLTMLVRQRASDSFSAMPLRRPYTAVVMGSERPYTAATMASARTSFTHVDLDTTHMPTIPGGGDNDDFERDRASQSDFHDGVEGAVPQTPQTSLTFLLVSGRRRQMTFEPETTIGRVKELVWNAWPSEWQDERPPAPSYLRILYLGKILQDEDTLAALSMPSYTPSSAYLPHPTSPTSPGSITASSQLPPTTIVHLSIRPYSGPADDDALKKKKTKRLSLFGRQASINEVAAAEDAADEAVEQRRGCCGCVIC